MLRELLALRYSHLMLNVSAWNEGGVSIFADKRHKSVNIAMSREQAIAISIKYYKACSIFAESMVDVSPGTPVNTKQTCVFLPTCTHPSPQMRHKISEVTGPKFTKFLPHRGIIIIGGVNAIVRVAMLSKVVEYQQRKWRQCVSIFVNMHHKSVTTATSLDRAVAIWINCYKAH